MKREARQMKLGDYTVTGFSEVLASGAPAPGGGSAAALEAALGAGLTAMVCRLTVGKAQFESHREALLEIQERTESLRLALLEVMDRDTEAFLQVSKAFALPKGSEEEKAARSNAIQRGLEACTRTPLEVMEMAAEALELAASLPGRFNENSASDLGVAALSLQAGLRGAWLNVCINVGSLRDQTLAQDCRERGEALLAKALPLAEQLCGHVGQIVRA